MKDVSPPPQPFHLELTVPGSKYEANRLITAAALTEGPSRIRGGPDNGDVRSAIRAYRDLGARIGGAPADLRIEGVSARRPAGIPAAPVRVNVGDSGTLFRFFTAAAAATGRAVEITGEGRIPDRPIAGLIRALEQLGAEVTTTRGHALLRLPGRPPAGGFVRVAARESSQFASALLLAAPRLRQGLTLELAEEPVSAPYLGLTVAVMARCGVPVRREGSRRFRVAPGSRYRPGVHRVSGDWTAAGTFLAAAAVARGQVEITGLDPDTPQGERRFPEILRAMGCTVRESGAGPDSFRIAIGGPPRLRALRVDMGTMPDAVPNLAAIAAFAEGRTVISGIGHLRFKESDRIGAMATGLVALGGRAKATTDGLVIEGGGLGAGVVDPAGDHRIAMAFALAGLRLPGIRIRNPEVVAKSFPGFWDALAGLGARIIDRA